MICQVVKILRHHDVGQVFVDAVGRALHVFHQRPQLASGLAVVRRAARQGLDHAQRVGTDALVFELGIVHRIQHPVGGIRGLAGDVVQAAAGIRQRLGGGLETGHQTQFTDGVVELSGHFADLSEDFVRRRFRERGGCHASAPVQATAGIFWMILLIFSSSVALVNGLTM